MQPVTPDTQQSAKPNDEIETNATNVMNELIQQHTIETTNNTNTLNSNTVSVGVTDACIKRLAASSGISRLGNSAYPEIRNIMQDYLVKIVGYAVVLMEHANRRTIMRSDIVQSLDVLGCKRNSVTFFPEDISNDALIPLNSFAKIVKNIAKGKSKTKKAPRMSDDAVQLLRNFIEGQLIRVLKNSKRNAIHSKRATIQGDDIVLAYSYYSVTDYTDQS